MNIQHINYDIMSMVKSKVDLNMVSDNMIDALRYKEQLQENHAIAKIEHLVDVREKQHNDALIKDPFWINGVHRYASLSKHNYLYMC